MYQAWTALKKGDVVGLVAPASTCSREDLTNVDNLLQSWGLKSHIADNIFGDDLLCANSRSVRFELLKHAFMDENIQAIWCIRGGYGSAQLIEALSTLSPPPKPKLFIGFSDITALHLFLQQQWGWQSLHGEAARHVALKKIHDEDITALREILFGERKHQTFLLTPLNAKAQLSQTITSTITGGNLSLIQTSIGTTWQLQSKHKILFLEDVNEAPYRIDRTLEHLQQARLLKEAHALVLGDFLEGKPNERPLMDQVLKRFADRQDFPVFRLRGIGHGTDNHPLPLGSKTTIDPQLTMTVSCCNF